MIYAWGIDINEKRIACGVVIAKNSTEAEATIRNDWDIYSGYFSYSIVNKTIESRQSVLLYKKI
jgi:hypothetical protein